MSRRFGDPKVSPALFGTHALTSAPVLTMARYRVCVTASPGSVTTLLTCEGRAGYIYGRLEFNDRVRQIQLEDVPSLVFRLTAATQDLFPKMLNVDTSGRSCVILDGPTPCVNLERSTLENTLMVSTLKTATRQPRQGIMGR
jgi:hypothetical protein